MNIKLKNILIGLAIVLICLAIGFFVGRAVKKETTKIEIRYEKGDPIHDTITVSGPVAVTEPIDTAKIIQQCIANGIYYELFPDKTVVDTQYIEITKSDTSAILVDWATAKAYEEILFDLDTLGRCDISLSVQYNRLADLSYTYTPVQKTTTVTTIKKKWFSPFIGVGIMTNPTDFANSLMPSVNAGFFIKERYGVNLQYARYIKAKEHIIGLSVSYKW